MAAIDTGSVYRGTMEHSHVPWGRHANRKYCRGMLITNTVVITMPGTAFVIRLDYQDSICDQHARTVFVISMLGPGMLVTVTVLAC